MSCHNGCNNLSEAACSEASYRYNALALLCRIADAIANQNKPFPITNVLSQVVKTAAELQSGYGSFESIGLITNVKKLNYVRVVNASDCSLEFSYDGGTTVAFTVLANTTYVENLNISFNSVNAFRMRRVSGQSAGFGEAIVEGRYNT